MGIRAWTLPAAFSELESQQDSPSRLGAEPRLEVMTLVTGTLSNESGLVNPKMPAGNKPRDPDQSDPQRGPWRPSFLEPYRLTHRDTDLPRGFFPAV